jgi:hypothetical protein
MTATTREKMRNFEEGSRWKWPLAVGNKGWKGAFAGLDLSTGKVEPMHAETDLFCLGRFAETVDATSVEKLVEVDLGRIIRIDFWVNAGDITAANIGSLAYAADDQTATISSSGNSVAGRIMRVETERGVGIMRLDAVPAAIATLDSLIAVETSPGAFVSNDLVLANNPNSGAIYDIPTTGAASTVTLPATAVEGTIVHFVADGTKNAHTVQYRDATGPVNLTTTLTASKRHMVTAAFLNGKWNANAYVSP